MTTEYTVTLEQIGSKGSVLFETNFGFAFVADRYATLKSTHITDIRRGERRERVLTMLSPCHQSTYEKMIDSWKCMKCKAELTIPAQYISREYETFEGKDLDALELLVSHGGMNSLEAVLVAQSLSEIIEKVWDKIDAGLRTREILALPEFSSEIPL